MLPRQPLIMIVEDQQEVGEMAAIFLTDAGYPARVLRSAAEALKYWETFKEHISLVITDWVMPDLFGDQLMARLLDEKPALKFIFMSGNPIASIDSPVPLEEGINYIQKPFDCQDLISIVSRRLDADGF